MQTNVRFIFNFLKSEFVKAYFILTKGVSQMHFLTVRKYPAINCNVIFFSRIIYPYYYTRT
jgi:hypothetical protein